VTYKDMTIADVVSDPLIGQMVLADGMSVRAMALLLQDAARRQLPTRTSHTVDATRALRGNCVALQGKKPRDAKMACLAFHHLRHSGEVRGGRHAISPDQLGGVAQ
jgi:hypothetical protein